MTGFFLAALIWLLPGLGIAVRLRGVWRRDPVLLAAVTLLCAMAVSTLAALLVLWLGLSAAVLSWILAGLAGAGAVAALGRERAGPALPDAPSRIEAALGVGSVFLLVLLGARLGATFRVTADTLDHVATLREILSSGSLFPRETFFVDAGLLGADPRKGLLHGVYAALALRSGMDPVDFWVNLPLLTTPCVFLAAYAFLRWIGQTPRWALLGGWLLVLTRSGGPGGDLATISAYPNQLGAALFWLAAGASVRAVAQGGRSHLGLAAAGIWAAVATHTMYALFALLLGGVLLLAVVLGAERASRVRRLLVVAGLAALPGVPYLLGRLAENAPANPIHTELQGMLLLTPRWYLVDPGRLWDDVGWFGCFAYPLALAVLGRRLRTDVGSALVALAPVVMAGVALNPLLVPTLREHVGYLLFRTFWFLPPALAVGMVLPLVARKPRWTRRAIAVLLVFLAVLPAARTAGTWLTPAHRRDGRLDALQFRDPLLRVTRGLPPRSVIASDPVTSSLLPAFTSHKGICPYDQHSSPNDARVEERLLASRDVLLPTMPPARAHRACTTWRASHVLVSSLWPPGFRTRTWAFQPGAADVRVDSLAASGGFREVREETGLVLLEVGADAPPSAEVPSSPGGAVAARVEVRDSVPAGGHLEVRVHWLPGPPPAGRGPVTASLRLDALDAPAGPLAKPRRKVTETLGGGTRRQRHDWSPGNGYSTPEHWTAVGTWDRVILPLSPRLLPGRYTIRVAVNRLPFVPNHTLRDYLSDEDLYSGDVVDTLTVLPVASS